MDVIGVITSVEDDEYQGKAHKKVTLGTGEVLKVKYGRDGDLKAKWGLLKEGVAIKFIMKDFIKPDGVKIPFVYDIEAVEGALSAPTTSGTAPAGDIPKTTSPQERGMWWKQLGDDLRSGHIDKSTPAGKTLRLRYFAEMFRVLDIEIKEDKAP